MNNYPTSYKKSSKPATYNYSKGYSMLPAINPNNTKVPNTIIPQHSKDHNIAGQIKTHIHLKNARGEEMNIYQTQQVLNLLNNAKGNWFINGTNGAKAHNFNGRRYSKNGK